MAVLMGTKEKKSPVDFDRVCSKCGKKFYFDRSCSGKIVICPYCGHRH